LAVANTNDFHEARAAHRGSATSATPCLSKDPTPQFNTGVFTPEACSSVVETRPIIEEEESSVVLDYEKIIKDLLDLWAANSEKIGQVVGEQVRRSPWVVLTDRHKLYKFLVTNINGMRSANRAKDERFIALIRIGVGPGVRPSALPKHIRYVIQGNQLGRPSNPQTVRGYRTTVTASG
jgi:hypothetical protein